MLDVNCELEVLDDRQSSRRRSLPTSIDDRSIQ